VAFLAGLPLPGFRAVFALKLIIAALATVLLLWDWAVERRVLRSRLTRARTLSLALLGVAALAAWWNFGQFHYSGGYLHYHEFFHYYLGSKYFPELGYTRLYDCVAAADAEQGFAMQASRRWVRNLETNELHVGSPAVLDPDLCRSRFSPGRWTAFTTDVSWFRAHMTKEKWAELSGDHGYNATPVWNVAGHLLSNTGPASWRQIRLLGFIDPVLLLAMWSLVWWAFGWRVACVAAVWWGTNYPARYTFIGGAFLREDWLLLAVAGICFARRGRMWLSGFSLTWAALLRVFPGFIVLGLLARIAMDSWRAKRVQIAPQQWKFAGGAVLALALLVPLSVTVGVGSRPDPSVWTAFARNSRKHLATPLTNNVGLRTVVSFAPSTRAARIRKYWIDSPWDVWMDARKRVFDERFPLYVALVALFLAGLASAVRGREDWVALTLAVGMIPVLTDLTGYYYGILLAYAFLWSRDRIIGIALALLSAVTCAAPAVLSQDDDRYAVVSAGILLLAALAFVWYGRAPRGAPAGDSLPRSAAAG
jgi:hypothetical protein